MNSVSQYLCPCSACGQKTSKSYARAHDGKCKSCFTGEPREAKSGHSSTGWDAEKREAFIIDHGYQAYAREEGHYDIPGE